MYGIVYKVTNLENDRVYIGKTKRTLEDRKSEHILSGISGCCTSLLHEDIGKYGPDSFNFEVVCHCETKDELNHKEVQVINEYPNSYNVRRRGVTKKNGIITRKIELPISCTISPWLADKLDVEAANQDRGRAYIIRKIITEYFERVDRRKKK